MSNKDEKWDKSLVNDDEFVEFVDAAFEKEGKPVDVLSKKRTWNEVESRVKDTVPTPAAKPEPAEAKADGDKFWQIGLALAACVLLSVAISVFRPMLEPDQGIKGTDLPVPVELVAYELLDGGEMELFKVGESEPPATLVPMVHATQPVYAALLSLTDEGIPEVLIPQQQFAAGQEQGFAVSHSELFAVEWTGEQREVYCVVAFIDQNDLVEELARLEQARSFTFDGNCLVLPRVD